MPIVMIGLSKALTGKGKGKVFAHAEISNRNYLRSHVIVMQYLLLHVTALTMAVMKHFPQ